MYMCWGSNSSPPEKFGINLFSEVVYYSGHQRHCIPIQKAALEEEN